MDKQTAISMMMQGKKVTHRYLSPWEWVTMKGRNYLFEDGVVCTPDMFWFDRQGPNWETDWEIWEPQPYMH